jgi:site-specific DNA-methyltransferase (adenine-specific)
MSSYTNEDCTDVMARLPDKSVDLAIVDPPYGIGDFNQKEHASKKYNKEWNIKWNKNIPNVNYFNTLLRVSKNQIIWGANYYNCFKTGGAIIWDKGNNSDIGSQCEIASNSLETRVIKYFEKWTGFINSEKEHNKIHPCQKPIALYKWLLSKYAKPGWLILDTHVGSASSLIACEDMGFDYIGCERT